MKKLFEDLKNRSFDEKIDIYLKAKAAYYEGKEFMSDAQFDKLEEEIKSINPTHPALKVVGYSSKRFEYSHLTPMLSLEKIQVNDEIEEEYEKINKWIKNSRTEDKLVIQPKYDGNSLSALYIDGELQHVLTRGDGKGGFDVTTKMVNIIPKNISIKDKVEIRGECLVDIKDFEKINKDDEFKNERNFVAGVLSDTKGNKNVDYLHFVSFGITNYSVENYSDIFDVLKEEGFEVSFYKLEKLESVEDIKKLYTFMKQYRENSNYRLDGYVIKVNLTKLRDKLGQNRHHPLSEIAIKFPAERGETVIESIEWTMSSKGELIPTAILKPVYIDGSVVSRAYLANLKNAITNSYLPGSKVQIEKKGDIIPQITGLVRSEQLSEDQIENLKPKTCPFCESDLEVTEDLTHIYCTNKDCPEISIKKMTKAIKILGVKHIGPAMVKTLYKAGVKNIFELFKKDLTPEILIETGEFKEGRQLERVFESISSIRKIKYSDLLRIEQIDGLGVTVSEMITRYYMGETYNFSGLEKQLIEMLIDKKDHFFVELPKKWESETSIKITYPEFKDSGDSIKVVLTGSPKSAGYPTKKHFLDRYKNFQEVKKIKDADMLVTNDLESNSKKMKDAKKNGLEIKTYEQIDSEGE